MQGLQQQHRKDSIQRFSLTLQLSQPLFRTPHTGSLLHGLLGHGLLACACNCPAAPTAHLRDCRYQAIFSPQPPTNWPARYNDCPPAYVMTPAVITEQPRARLDFQLSLLGQLVTPTPSIGLIEAAGCSMANDLAQRQLPLTA